MPNRLYSRMTAKQFVAWCDRHAMDSRTCQEILGVCYTQYFKYRNGRVRIPVVLAKLCDALDLIHDYKTIEAYTLSPHDLAAICADPMRKTGSADNH